MLHGQPGKSADVHAGFKHTDFTSVTVCVLDTETLPGGESPPDHLVDSTVTPPTSASCQPSHSPLRNTTSVTNGKTSRTLDMDSLAPPRLPPRRSQSLNENSEKAGVLSSVLPGSLRRSSSTEDSHDTQAPALPPRQPHGIRTPLNARPRERKFPLQIHLSPQEKSPTSLNPSSPKHANSPKQTPHLKSPHAAPTSSACSTSPHSPQQFSSPTTSSRHQGAHWQSPNITSPSSPTRNPINRHSCLHNPPRSQSFETPVHTYHLHHHHHSSSIELPPPYDLSVQQSVSLSDVADSEPTHMLLDPHSSHLPLPLSVSLPLSSDLTAIDEPTHVSLSSLSANKHSWSATFTSPSPLSPSFHHRQQPTRSSQLSSSSPVTRTLDRSFSSDPKAPSIYPDASDNQSPPADLPPAPPTPSYRHKLGLEHQRPKVVRSISHNSNTFKCGGPHFLSVDSPSSQASFRGRSASTNSPSSHSHHMDVCSTSPSHNSHRLPHYPHEISVVDSDAFFAEAPAYPHPYSQSPFHPLASSRNNCRTSVIYSSVSFPQSPSDISPYQISSAISAPAHAPKNQPQFDTPPPAIPRSAEHHSSDSHTHTPPTQNSTPRHTIPRTTLSHTYNSVCLPPSHHAPDPSKSTSNNLTAKPTNSLARRPDAQTSSSSRQHPTSPSSTTSQIFKFPSVIRTEGSFSPSPSPSAAAAQPNHRISKHNPDLSPSMEYPSSSEVSPLMFASYNATSSVSYEDLRQFALDR